MSEERDVYVVEDVAEGTRRRMPDHFRPHLIKMQGGKKYLPAAFRLVWFRDEVGETYGIRTQIIEGGHADGYATVRAEIYDRENFVVSTGTKTEEKKDFPAGWVEKAETGAVSRALSMMGYGTSFDDTLFNYDQEGHVTDSPQGKTIPQTTTTVPVATTPSPTNGTVPPTIRDWQKKVKVLADGDKLPAKEVIEVVKHHFKDTAYEELTINDWKYVHDNWEGVLSAYKMDRKEHVV
jgi:hypothetical protein